MLSGLNNGFGSATLEIGMVVLLVGIFGEIMIISGATEEMAKDLLRKSRRKGRLFSIKLARFIISIHVFSVKVI